MSVRRRHLLVQVSDVDLHRLLQVSHRQVGHAAGHHVAAEGAAQLLLLGEGEGRSQSVRLRPPLALPLLAPPTDLEQVGAAEEHEVNP